MNAPSPSAGAAHSPDHGATFIALLCAALWCGLVLVAYGTPLAAPTVLATAASLGLTSWLWRERRRLRRELIQQQAERDKLAAHAALVEMSFAADIEQVIAHSAALFGATRAWLEVEPHAGAEHHVWSADGTAVSDEPGWWQSVFDGDELFIGHDTSPARAAARLRQDDAMLGVLAFEAAHTERAWDAREACLLRVLAALLSHMLLRQRLERALQEATEQGARERRTFLAHLSHKLRTPMTAVLGFAQILSFDQGLSAEHREFVQEIDTAGRALLNMINELVGVPRE